MPNYCFLSLYSVSVSKYIYAHFFHNFILCLSLSPANWLHFEKPAANKVNIQSMEVWADNKFKEALQWDGHHRSPQGKQWLSHILTILLSVMCAGSFREMIPAEI